MTDQLSEDHPYIARLLVAIEQSDSQQAESILRLILQTPDAEPQVHPWSNKYGISASLLLKDALTQRSIADNVFITAITSRLVVECKSERGRPWECQLTDFIMHSVCSSVRSLYTSSLIGVTRDVVNYLANSRSAEVSRLELWLRTFVSMQPLEHPDYWRAILNGRIALAPTIAEAFVKFHPERAFDLMCELQYDEAIVNAIDHLMWYFVETHGIRYVESCLLRPFLKNAPREVCQQLQRGISELGLSIQLDSYTPGIEAEQLTNEDIIRKRDSIRNTFFTAKEKAIDEAISIAREYDSLASRESAVFLSVLDLDRGKHRFAMTPEMKALFFSEPVFWIAEDVFTLSMTSNGFLSLTLSLEFFFQKWHSLTSLLEDYYRTHRIAPFRQTILRTALEDRTRIRKRRKILEKVK